ncbi:NCS2 family permease [Candidatus Soleaferrea massiliensis]|uniref:NCS2 family permease n=1 Tax=Candidatus Soleaferrea massiliensis TaxID=1470354 RepID=UPI001FA70B15|nr:NCS2 family permease [Candidatus Soleaferrea massiliensis]
MDRFFKLKENGTNVRTEIVAGLTTFFTMSYIIFVNPTMLSATGMSWGGVFVSTILAAVVGTLIMGLYANIPYAQASGMGLNAFFTFTVCFGLGFSWQQALALVIICGVLNIIVTVTKVRKQLILAIPKSLQKAIGGGIGLFIAYIGIKNAHFIDFTTDPQNVVATLEDGTVVSNSGIVPALSNFTEAIAVVAALGLAITIILMVLKVKGAILIGIIATTIVAIPFGLVTMPEKIFDISSVAAIQDTAFQAFTPEGFGSLFNNIEKVPLVILTVFIFSLSDMFDTIGTFIGTGRKSGIFSEEEEKKLMDGKGLKSRIEKGLLADSIATMTGGILGTSNVTTYVESSAGIGVGGRTGLTAVVVAILFLLCLPFAPLFGMVPAAATAPALIVVGILMMSSIKDIDWHDFSVAAPAFLTVAMMPFAYSISYGLGIGFIFYCIIKLFTGKAKELHPIFIGATALFLINFIIMGVMNL